MKSKFIRISSLAIATSMLTGGAVAQAQSAPSADGIFTTITADITTARAAVTPARAPVTTARTALNAAEGNVQAIRATLREADVALLNTFLTDSRASTAATAAVTTATTAQTAANTARTAAFDTLGTATT